MMRIVEVITILVVLVCAVVAIFFLLKPSDAGMAISTTYHYVEGEKGITTVPQVGVEFPTIPYVQLLGTRFPAFVLLDSAGLYDLSKCKGDLIWKAHVSNPKDRFSCYNTPLGQYIQERPVDPWGRTRFKGNLFCYARTTGSEGQGIDSEKAVRDKMLAVLVESQETSWTKIMAINSEGVAIEMPVCA